MTTDHTPDIQDLIAAALRNVFPSAADARAAYDAALAQARAEGRREGIMQAAEVDYERLLDDAETCMSGNRLRASVILDAISALSDAPAPAVTVGEAARAPELAALIEAAGYVRSLDQDDDEVIVKRSAYINLRQALRVLAEGGAGRDEAPPAAQEGGDA